MSEIPNEFRVGSHPPLKNPGVYGKDPFNGDPKDFAWSSGAMRKNFEAVDRMLASYGMKLVYLGGDDATGEFVAYGNNVLWHRHYPYDGAKIALNVLYINGKKRKLSTVMDMDPGERHTLFGKVASLSEDPIEKFLAVNNITKYTIEKDGSVSFPEAITITGDIPFKIKRASFIRLNDPISLNGLPKIVKKLLLIGPRMDTLEGCPSGGILDIDGCSRLQSLKGIGQFEEYEFWNIKMPYYEMRYLLLRNVKRMFMKGDGLRDGLKEILMGGRINGEMPSELIPGKIKQLKDLV